MKKVIVVFIVFMCSLGRADVNDANTLTLNSCWAKILELEKIVKSQQYQLERLTDALNEKTLKSPQVVNDENTARPKFIDAVKVLQLYIDNPIEFEANMIGQRFSTRGYIVNIANSCVWLGDKNAIQTVKHPTSKWDITLQVKPIISCLLQSDTSIKELKVGDVAIFSGIFNSYQISENNPGIMILTNCIIEK